MHNMESIVGAAWLRSVDIILDEIKSEEKHGAIRKIDKAFGNAMDSFWDSAIESKIEYNEMYDFAFAFFVNFHRRLVKKKP